MSENEIKPGDVVVNIRSGNKGVVEKVYEYAKGVRVRMLGSYKKTRRSIWVADSIRRDDSRPLYEMAELYTSFIMEREGAADIRESIYGAYMQGYTDAMRVKTEM